MKELSDAAEDYQLLHTHSEHAVCQVLVKLGNLLAEGGLYSNVFRVRHDPGPSFAHKKSSLASQMRFEGPIGMLSRSVWTHEGSWLALHLIEWEAHGLRPTAAQSRRPPSATDGRVCAAGSRSRGIRLMG